MELDRDKDCGDHHKAKDCKRKDLCCCCCSWGYVIGFVLLGLLIIQR